MQLQTLGGLALQGSSFGRPKPLLLLTHLALEGARDRHHLAELFWPDAAEPMGSLRVALAQLRAAAPEALGAADAGLAAKVDADAVGLLRALDADNPAKATELYRGAFLAGFYLAGLGSELEEWVYSTQEFSGTRVRDALLTLAERDAAVGDFRAAARRAEGASKLPGAPPLEPEGFARLYRLLVAGSSAHADDLRREAQGYGVALVFVGGFTREAASQVAGASIPLLASLVDKSLLRVLAGGDALIATRCSTATPARSSPSTRKRKPPPGPRTPATFWSWPRRARRSTAARGRWTGSGGWKTSMTTCVAGTALEVAPRRRRSCGRAGGKRAGCGAARGALGAGP